MTGETHSPSEVPSPSAPQSLPLDKLLAGRIQKHGPISFAEFMEACLYHPQHGYYTRGEQHRAGDYYTSVDLHPVFGRLLARQFAEMWQLMGRPSQFDLVECGAGEGRLALHILEFSARALPEFYTALRYFAVERSAARREEIRAALRSIPDAKLKIQETLAGSIPAGCIFSNELLDALPVHRVTQQAGDLREIYVDRQRDKFVDLIGPLSTPRLASYFAELGIALLDGTQAEACLAACNWIEQAGRALDRGFVLTIDYGHEARELYNESHARGTLLAYHEHRVNEDYYVRPGEQDLTAHVNFTALDVWGQKAGLCPLGLVSQSHFLMALGRVNEFADLYDGGMTETDRIGARLKLKSLIYPEGMGETFSVFVQQKGLSNETRLTGLQSL